MSMIKVEALTFAYPGSSENVFEDVSFQIDTDWKLGFVGRNGRGKTTFFRLLQGQYEYSGKIISSVQFDYFPYEIEDMTQTVRAIMCSVCPEVQEWEVQREFSLLKLADDMMERTFETLSNGERTKVLLAGLFLNEGHFLLIDEPTNHLDMEGRQLVSEYLNRKSGYILVSHDRAFLDGCVDHILAVNRTNIEVQSGNFSSWFENFERQQNFELRRNERLKKDIGRLQSAARQSASWSDKVEKSKYNQEKTKHNPKAAAAKVDRGFIGHKAAKMMKRSKNLEARTKQALSEKQGLLKNVEVCEELIMNPMQLHTDRLVSLDNVSVQYGEKEVCREVSFEVTTGERVALVGGNGCGKSSILHLITGCDISHSGRFVLPSGLVISYVPQDASHLKGSLRDYAHEAEIDESLFKTVLRKLDFERVQLERDMSELSGGQKKKVLLARSLCERAHLYIWDEPLNYIDIYSRIQIENVIAEFKPSMLFVEHDRRFVEDIATKTVAL